MREVHTRAIIQVNVFRQPVQVIDNVQAGTTIKVQPPVNRVVIEKVQDIGLQVFLEDDTLGLWRKPGIFLGKRML